MNAGGGSFGSFWGGAFRWYCPGSCDGVACVAVSGSRTTRPFALPRKRYVQSPVLEKAAEYVGTDHTYRRTAEHEEGGCRMPILYDDRTPEGLERASGLAPSTVWRWLSWLGGMPDVFQAACGLIRQKDPNSTLHRQPWVVSPKKHRSEQRRKTLEQAMQVLAADRICGHLFSSGLFPRYATGRGPP